MVRRLLGRFGDGVALAAAEWACCEGWRITRRVVALWAVLGCFGVGAALAAAEFFLEVCCEDLRLSGRLLALL